MERAMFNRSKQEKSVDTFITALYTLTLSEHCNSGALTEEMIHDWIVIGWRDSNLSIKLELDEKLDIHKAIMQVREAGTI